MIQRIQSIYLALAAIALALLFMIPFVTSTEAIPNMLQDKVYNIQDSPILIGLTVIGILVSLVAIFYIAIEAYKRISYFSIIC